MSKPVQEALAPHTDAIPRGTVEITPLANGKWRVRGKGLAGYVFRQDFEQVHEAMEYF